MRAMLLDLPSCLTSFITTLDRPEITPANLGITSLIAITRPGAGAVNLEEHGSTEVRRFFCDNALMWLRDYRFDGLRLDAIQTYIDRSARHFLEQLADEVQALSIESDRPLVLIAESDLNDPRVVTPQIDEAGHPTYGYGG